MAVSTPSVTIQTLGGALFEEFFQSIVDQEGFDDSQKGELVKYLEGAIEKRDRLGEFITRMESEGKAIREEEKRLATRRQGFEKIANCIRESIHEQMREWQIKKVEGKLYTFAVQKNPASVEIFDEAQIPGEFLDYTPQVDKNKVKEALVAGQQIKTGDVVRFAHQTEEGPDHAVAAIAPDGMVALDDMAGLFAPHCFVKPYPVVPGARLITDKTRLVIR
jgi:Siphovirus Gp157